MTREAFALGCGRQRCHSPFYAKYFTSANLQDVAFYWKTWVSVPVEPLLELQIELIPVVTRADKLGVVGAGVIEGVSVDFKLGNVDMGSRAGVDETMVSRVLEKTKHLFHAGEVLLIGIGVGG